MDRSDRVCPITPQAPRDSSTPVRHVARPSVRVFGDPFHIILRSIFREGHEITLGQSAGGVRALNVPARAFTAWSVLNRVSSASARVLPSN